MNIPENLYPRLQENSNVYQTKPRGTCHEVYLLQSKNIKAREGNPLLYPGLVMRFLGYVCFLIIEVLEIYSSEI